MGDVTEYYLTTMDNPYNPFTQQDEWYEYDTLMGYDTCGYLARLAHTSSGLSDVDNSLEIDRAILSIITLNINNLYQRVTRESFATRITV